MTQQKARVDVLDVQRFSDKGNLKAFADIRLGRSVKVYGFRVVQQPGQKAWVSPPQRTWQGNDGKAKYAPIVELLGDFKEEVEQAILAAYFDVKPPG